MRRLSKYLWVSMLLASASGCATSNLFTSSNGPDVRQARVQRLLSIANDCEHQGRANEAMQVYRYVLAQEPENPVARQRLDLLARAGGTSTTPTQQAAPVQPAPVTTPVSQETILAARPQPSQPVHRPAIQPAIQPSANWSPTQLKPQSTEQNDLVASESRQAVAATSATWVAQATPTPVASTPAESVSSEPQWTASSKSVVTTQAQQEHVEVRQQASLATTMSTNVVERVSATTTSDRSVQSVESRQASWTPTLASMSEIVPASQSAARELPRVEAVEIMPTPVKLASTTPTPVIPAELPTPAAPQLPPVPVAAVTPSSSSGELAGASARESLPFEKKPAAIRDSQIPTLSRSRNPIPNLELYLAGKRVTEEAKSSSELIASSKSETAISSSPTAPKIIEIPREEVPVRFAEVPAAAVPAVEIPVAEVPAVEIPVAEVVSKPAEIVSKPVEAVAVESVSVAVVTETKTETKTVATKESWLTTPVSPLRESSPPLFPVEIETEKSSPAKGEEAWEPTRLVALCDNLPAELVPIVEQMESKDAIARVNALLKLSEHGTEAREARVAVHALLEDPEPVVAVYAATTLRTIANDAWESVQTLCQYLNHDDPQIVRLAAYLLGEIGPEAMEAVPHLERIRENGDLTTRLHAAEALTHIAPGDRASLNLLCNALFHSNEDIRWFAAISLGTVSQECEAEAIAVLMKALQDASPDVKSAVCLSLGGFGKQAAAAIPELEKAAKSDSADVKSAAETALACLRG